MRARVSSSTLGGAMGALMSLLLSVEALPAEAGVPGGTPASAGRAQGGATPLAAGTARLVEFEGTVEIQRAGARVWDPGYTNAVMHPGDQLRTGDRSRAAVLLSDLTVLRLAALSHIQIPDPKQRT